MHEHLPVLYKESLDGLAIKPDGIYIDATFGRGGHSLGILQQLGPDGRLIAFDKDPEAIKHAKQGPFLDARFSIEHVSFAKLQERIEERGLVGKISGVLMDLGVSSPQLDDPLRGFSFTREGPLDMRMNPQLGMSAADWLQNAESQEISRVLRVYGEERFSNRIARAIVAAREEKPLTTTKQLADLIAASVPSHEFKKHPATRSFQGIRIFINGELEELKDGLLQVLEVLSVSGRMSVISFHSLEDRIVKRFIEKEAKGDPFPANFPVKEVDLKRRLRKIGGLVRPGDDEINNNARSRSGRLRIAEKIK